MTETIHVDQFLAQPPAKVWRMLTEPDRLASWWAPGDIRPEVGHSFTLDMRGWGVQSCTVTEVDEERLLSYTFGEGDMDWTITWRLVAEGAGTRLFLEHGGFDLDDPRQQSAFTNMPRGWAGSVLPRLARELAEVTA
ncbi:MAG: SRPBCC domain-containing protein [Actinophytocola sp.]|uniref:SRPBCC family protein n=1 Tax=Actinophytocola sp. TaxID=1872138 RepID=UPI003C78524B